MREIFLGFVDLEQGGMEVLPSPGFNFLDLNSLRLDLLVLNPWILTFAKMAWEKQWLLKQRTSKSRIIALDFRPTLAFALIILCIISSKFMDFRFCYSIFTLIEALSSF